MPKYWTRNLKRQASCVSDFECKKRTQILKFVRKSNFAGSPLGPEIERSNPHFYFWLVSLPSKNRPLTFSSQFWQLFYFQIFCSIIITYVLGCSCLKYWLVKRFLLGEGSSANAWVVFVFHISIYVFSRCYARKLIWNHFTRELRFEPGTAGWEARTLPLCYPNA